MGSVGLVGLPTLRLFTTDSSMSEVPCLLIMIFKQNSLAKKRGREKNKINPCPCYGVNRFTPSRTDASVNGRKLQKKPEKKNICTRDAGSARGEPVHAILVHVPVNMASSCFQTSTFSQTCPFAQQTTWPKCYFSEAFRIDFLWVVFPQ